MEWSVVLCLPINSTFSVSVLLFFLKFRNLDTAIYCDLSNNSYPKLVDHPLQNTFGGTSNVITTSVTIMQLFFFWK